MKKTSSNCQCYLDISFDNFKLDDTLQGQAVPLISEIGRQLPFGVFFKQFFWPLLILFTRGPRPLLWYWFQSFLSTASSRIEVLFLYIFTLDYACAEVCLRSASFYIAAINSITKFNPLGPPPLRNVGNFSLLFDLHLWKQTEELEAYRN